MDNAKYNLCMCGYEHEMKDVPYRREYGPKENAPQI
jgi:hypothetical protein